jgi:hypothetical protein
MYDHIKVGLDKIEHDARFLRDLWSMGVSGQPFGFMLPPRAAEAMATCYIITAVSIFDEALELVLTTNFTPAGKDLKNLKTMIDYAARANGMLNAKALQDLRETRNDLAHELVQYRDWSYLDYALQLIRTELEKLGVL